MPPHDLYPGATEPIWYGERKVYSVTGFNHGVKNLISDLPMFWVEGEVSELRHTPRYSLVYLTLKDPNNGFMLSGTMPRGRFESLGLNISNGDLIQAQGRAELYPARGSFQLKIMTMEHAGRGLLMQQLEALAAKLQSEGLFDPARKRPLPFLPRKVGVVTGAEAAAQGDFVRQITERYPLVKLVIVETLVQGDRAAPQIVAAIRKLDAMEDVDVIVVTRGGGAFEDMLPFSDERVCRAIAASSTPTVSAIGHEKDSPISDHVADLRVSTPTAAARTVVPDHAVLVDQLERAQRALTRRGTDRLNQRLTAMSALRLRLDARSPARFLDERRRYLANMISRSRMSLGATVDDRRHVLARHRRGLSTIVPRVEHARRALGRERRDLGRLVATRVGEHRARHGAAVGKLRALSPRATLLRGYAIVRGADDEIVRDARTQTPGDAVTLTLASGTLHATIRAAKDTE